VVPFAIEKREIEESIWEISVEGELDLAVADQLDNAIEEIADSCRGLVIGLRECEFLDSTGIAVIVRAYRRFESEGRRLVICCPEDQVERVLDITGLSQNGLVLGSMDEAVAAVRD
jgi:anti-anti-sigma factor